MKQNEQNVVIIVLRKVTINITSVVFHFNIRYGLSLSLFALEEIRSFSLHCQYVCTVLYILGENKSTTMLFVQ
jgi:hypothetical protein